MGKREVGGGGRASRAASSSGSILSDKTDKHSTKKWTSQFARQCLFYFTGSDIRQHTDVVEIIYHKRTDKLSKIKSTYDYDTSGRKHDCASLCFM